MDRVHYLFEQVMLSGQNGTPMSLAFDPYELGGVRLANRIVMSPMTRSRAHGPGAVPGDLAAEYYAQRAGAGLIVTEGTWVNADAIGFIHAPGIYSDTQTAGWVKVTEAVHEAGGRIVSQFGHLGAA